MNTQNSQTAATPTAGTWFKNLSLEQLRARRTQHMRLTELENVLIESATEDYADDALYFSGQGR